MYAPKNYDKIKNMIIWLTRHGQTELNRQRLMQSYTDAPLNETGIAQAEMRRRDILTRFPGITFDAVYASPLQRAVTTGAIIGGVDETEVIRDARIVEANFGRYEMKKYYLMGMRMALFWVCPEVFPAPPTAETAASMIERAHGFLRELEQKDYENVLVSCHGGILRVLTGYLEDRPSGYLWRPHPHNCEVRVYESQNGSHHKVIWLRD